MADIKLDTSNTHTCKHARTQTRTQARTHVRTHTHTHTYAHTHTHPTHTHSSSYQSYLGTCRECGHIWDSGLQSQPPSSTATLYDTRTGTGRRTYSWPICLKQKEINSSLPVVTSRSWSWLWMKIYIWRIQISHKTLRVHSARCTQCIYVRSQKLKLPKGIDTNKVQTAPTHPTPSQKCNYTQ